MATGAQTFLRTKAITPRERQIAEHAFMAGADFARYHRPVPDGNDIGAEGRARYREFVPPVAFSARPPWWRRWLA